MNPVGLADTASNVLGAVGVLLIPAYYYFDKKAEHTYGLSKELEDALPQMRRAITLDLSTLLKPIFDKPAIQVSVTAENYVEKDSNPVGSEPYKDALKTFIDGNISSIIEYGLIRTFCTEHLCWLTKIIYTIRSLFIWIALSYLFVFSPVLFGWTSPEWVFKVIICAVFIMVLLIVIFECMRWEFARKATELRNKYESL